MYSGKFKFFCTSKLGIFFAGNRLIRKVTMGYYKKHSESELPVPIVTCLIDKTFT